MASKYQFSSAKIKAWSEPGIQLKNLSAVSPSLICQCDSLCSGLSKHSFLLFIWIYFLKGSNSLFFSNCVILILVCSAIFKLCPSTRSLRFCLHPNLSPLAHVAALYCKFPAHESVLLHLTDCFLSGCTTSGTPKGDKVLKIWTSVHPINVVAAEPERLLPMLTATFARMGMISKGISLFPCVSLKLRIMWASWLRDMKSRHSVIHWASGNVPEVCWDICGDQC